MPGGVGGEGPGSPVLPYPDSNSHRIPPSSVENERSTPSREPVKTAPGIALAAAQLPE